MDEVNSPVFLLMQGIVEGWDEMKKLHDVYVQEGFEGAVIKDMDKPYKPGSRGNQLIKIKQYKSSEFKVIGYELGLRGSEDMTFILETENGDTFKAMPVGDRETKSEYVRNFEEKYNGHMAECTYFNLSDDGIPTQPKLRIFRFDLE
jgi:ATP-dependent DNA ligase